MELHEYLNMPLIKPTSIPNPNVFTELGHMYSDLYPNSPQDSYLWLELFVIASKIDHDLTLRLEYVRNVGAWLLLDPVWGFKIQPIIDPAGMLGWNSLQQYESHGRSELMKHSEQVANALKELRRRFDLKMIR